MKFKAFLVIAAAAAMLFPSCGEKEPETGAAELTIKSEATVNFESAESSQTVKFVATREWTAKVSETATSWLSVTPTSGKASSKEQTLTIEVLGNPEKDRFGTVTVLSYEAALAVILEKGHAPIPDTVFNSEADGLDLAVIVVKILGG